MLFRSKKPVSNISPSAATSTTATSFAPPLDVYADYTPIGGVVTWKAPQGGTTPSQYLIQASYKGGDFSTIATVDSSTFKLELMKVDTPSETIFRVIAVYPSGQGESDTSSIKGQYEVNQ